MRVLEIRSQSEIRAELKKIGVDPYGIELMAPKAAGILIKMDAISPICANILKQEMLSFGGDAAVARHALTGTKKPTGCLLIGTQAHYSRLIEKLRAQPFGLRELAQKIKTTLENFQAEEFILRMGKYRLTCGKRTRILGILNLTPDSFSGDGLLPERVVEGARLKKSDTGWIVEHVRQMVSDGADIIDIGGESSRPGAAEVSITEETHRTIPVIRAIAKKINVPISIDTRKPEVARAALENGAALVNDISGLRDRRMRSLIARSRAGAVIMHMRGSSPRTMQKKPRYECVTAEIISFLRAATRAAQDTGIEKDRLIIDPGIGFGKTTAHNLTILRHLREFKTLGLAILIGTSRKSFIAQLTGGAPHERLPGTIASCAAAAAAGAHIVRVHDVKDLRQALDVQDAINNA